MFYKPAYCCHCGEKIENTENLPHLKSGRFCDACRKEFPLQEWLPRVFVLICAIFGLFGLGSYLQSSEGASSAALRPNKVSAPVLPLSNGTGERSVPKLQEANRQVRKGSEPESSAAAGKTVSASGEKEIERVYFCGAATKKGTPCSRKVKGGGRCWQHKGQEAMLGREKLLITQ